MKLHDIPNTVAKAVEALAPLEPAVLTVHAAGGRAMLEAAKAAAPEGTKVVAVTVLTSLDGEDLRAIGVASEPRQQVARLAKLARSAGLGRHRLLRRGSGGCTCGMAQRFLCRSGRAAGRS